MSNQGCNAPTPQANDIHTWYPIENSGAALEFLRLGRSVERKYRINRHRCYTDGGYQHTWISISTDARFRFSTVNLRCGWTFEWWSPARVRVRLWIHNTSDHSRSRSLSVFEGVIGIRGTGHTYVAYRTMHNEGWYTEDRERHGNIAQLSMGEKYLPGTYYGLTYQPYNSSLGLVREWRVTSTAKPGATRRRLDSVKKHFAPYPSFPRSMQE